MGHLTKFKGSFIEDRLDKDTRSYICESFDAQEGSLGSVNPFFWPKYTLTYLDLNAAKKLEQPRNALNQNEYVGPGKIIKGRLLNKTKSNDKAPIVAGLVLKFIKDDESNILAIECLDCSTRNVILIDPNNEVIII